MRRRLERNSGGKQPRPSRKDARLHAFRQRSLRQDLERIDRFRERQRANSRTSSSVPIFRPRSATLMDERMFSSAFRTRRNAAIAWTSESLGSALIVTGYPVLDADSGKAGFHRTPQPTPDPSTVWLWKNGPVSADSTTGGLLNSSNSKCPKGGGRSSVLPKEPNTVRICPKPPSRGKPSASASGISFTLVAEQHVESAVDCRRYPGIPASAG